MGGSEMIDADWAWAPFQPTTENHWDKRAAAHLYRRAGFAANFDQLRRAVKLSPQKVVDELLAVDQESEEFREQSAALVRAALATGNIQTLAAQWVYRMLETPVQLLEKMTLFWHGHFATSHAKVGDAALMQAQHELLRRYSLGDFRTLVLEISRDPSMLIYLDSASNRKSHPNENFARELMELFCLGEGRYSEQDIRELARCFTGWEVRRERFRVNHYQHDEGVKSVLGQSGSFGGEEGVAIVLEQPAATRHIAQELVRFFVADDLPENFDSLVEPLADQLRRDAFHVAPTVRRILSSNLFFSPHAFARKIKSPIEHSVGWLRALEGSTDTNALSQALDRMGQALFRPPSVKGWDGGKDWINSSTLLERSNVIRRLLDSSKTRYGERGLRDYLKAQGVSADNFVSRMETLLCAVPLATDSKKQIERVLRGSGESPERRAKDAMHLLCTLPEFQLA